MFFATSSNRCDEEGRDGMSEKNTVQAKNESSREPLRSPAPDQSTSVSEVTKAEKAKSELDQLKDHLANTSLAQLRELGPLSRPE